MLSRQISHWKKQMRFHGLALGANIRSINYGHKEGRRVGEEFLPVQEGCGYGL